MRTAPPHLNRLDDPSRKELVFSPLIDIPLNAVNISIKETGLDLQAIQDVRAEIQSDDSIKYTPLTYNTVIDFARTHGLTKELLTASNVVQFGAAGHEVALFFGEEKVHYYDNVYYPQQVAVYGTAGPVYEEAKYFKDNPLATMDEGELFTRLFQEIYYRLEQVARVRGEGAYSNTTIKFFKKPLIVHGT